MARRQVDIQLEDQVGARWVGTLAGAPQLWVGTLVGVLWWIGTTVGAQWDSARLQPPVQRGPEGFNFILACGVVMVVTR